MDKIMKVLSYVLRGLSLLFLILDLCQVGSFIGIAIAMVGLYLIVLSREEFAAGKKKSAWSSIVIGLFVIIVSAVRYIAW